jgi:hypothetical protein
MDLRSIIIIIVVIVIFIYYIFLQSNTSNETFANPTIPAKPTKIPDELDKLLDDDYVPLIANNSIIYPEPPIYTEAFTKTKDLADLLKFNLKIDSLSKEYDIKTNVKYQRLLVPLHIIYTMDKKYLAVFNDGRLYIKNNLFDDALWIGPLNNSLVGTQEDGIGMRMIMFFPLNVNNERQIKLLGVGDDGFLYYKESEDIQSPWIKSTGEMNEGLIYIFCDFYQEKVNYYPLLYGITFEGKIVYKNQNNQDPIDTISADDFMKLPFTEPSKPIVNNAKMLKVYWDKNGFLLGIGQDFKIYQKKGIDWKVRPWEVDQKMRGTTSGALTKVIDLMMDADSRMIGLVLDSTNKPPTIKVQKQIMTYYLSDFDSISVVGKGNKVFTDNQMIKYKSGIDWDTYLSFEDPDEAIYRNNNLQALKQRSVINDKYKLRKLCKSRNPIMNVEARNFDLETSVKQNEKKITALNKELDGLIKFSKNLLPPKQKQTNPTLSPTLTPT